MSTKTNHADLLNALDVMQRSPVYVLRRGTLREAELLIARQEREIEELKAAAPRDLTDEQIANVCCGIMPSEHGATGYDQAIADAVLRAAGVRKEAA